MSLEYHDCDVCKKKDVAEDLIYKCERCGKYMCYICVHDIGRSIEDVLNDSDEFELKKEYCLFCNNTP